MSNKRKREEGDEIQQELDKTEAQPSPVSKQDAPDSKEEHRFGTEVLPVQKPKHDASDMKKVNPLPEYVHPFADRPFFCNITILTKDGMEIKTDRTFLGAHSDTLAEILSAPSENPNQLSLPYNYSLLSAAFWLMDQIGDPKYGEDYDRDWDEELEEIDDVDTWIQLMELGIKYNIVNLRLVCSIALNATDGLRFTVDEVVKIYKLSQSYKDLEEAKSLAKGCAIYFENHKNPWKKLFKDADQDKKSLLDFSLRKIKFKARSYELFEGLYVAVRNCNYYRAPDKKTCARRYLEELPNSTKKKFANMIKLSLSNSDASFYKDILLHLTEETAEKVLTFLK